MLRSNPLGSRTVLAAAIGAVLSIPTALAQRGNEVTVEVSDCLEIEAPDERLACFERRVEAARGREQAPARPAAPPPAAPPPQAAAPAPAAPPPQAATPAPAAPPAAPAREERDDDSFGRAPEQASRREERAARNEQLEGQELVAKVTAVRETIPNNYTITLDNGQVWRQNRPQFYPLQPGYEVRISPTRWGSSYRLTAPILKGYIQVERVR